MAAPTNHWKLGLFVVGSFVLGLSVLVFLGAQSLQQETVTYTTYFDESVQGLEIGSAVKFRGVTIGNVSRIDIAGDRRHVEVASDLVVEDIVGLGIAYGKGENTQIRVPAELRMQLASAGITGIKFLQLDFFPIEDNPPPVLPFPVPPNYIPSAVSVIKNIEDSIVSAVNRIPEVADRALLIMSRVDLMLGKLDEKKVPDQIEGVLTRTNRVLEELELALKGLQTAELSSEAQATLGNINQAVVKMNGLLDRMSSENGMAQSAQRASDAVGDVARNMSGLGVEVEQTLRAIQEAATSIQRLTDALEQDSDMLLKGRARKAK